MLSTRIPEISVYILDKPFAKRVYIPPTFDSSGCINSYFCLSILSSGLIRSYLDLKATVSGAIHSFLDLRSIVSGSIHSYLDLKIGVSGFIHSFLDLRASVSGSINTYLDLLASIDCGTSIDSSTLVGEAIQTLTLISPNNGTGYSNASNITDGNTSTFGFLDASSSTVTIQWSVSSSEYVDKVRVLWKGTDSGGNPVDVGGAPVTPWIINLKCGSTIIHSLNLLDQGNLSPIWEEFDLATAYAVDTIELTGNTGAAVPYAKFYELEVYEAHS